MILWESGLARYLHSAVILSGTVLVFGGNTHNDTSLSNGAKCFSADFMAYDIGKSKSDIITHIHRGDSIAETQLTHIDHVKLKYTV